ncbi:hypothetical protein EDC96DRAFT_581703 [Choanephora cucurbitarum]|nr:hypothetical protein EDC96DRAFT_581703 [Choanephora cucurbitarum]
MEGLSFVNYSQNMFANADKEPVTVEIFMAEAFQPTPLELMEPYQGMIIKGRSQGWYRKQGLSVYAPSKSPKEKRSSTEKTHAKFYKWLCEYQEMMKKRDDLIQKTNKFHDELVNETIKYCHHLHEEPTTQKSFDTYQTGRSNVVKSLLRRHSPI